MVNRSRNTKDSQIMVEKSECHNFYLINVSRNKHLPGTAMSKDIMLMTMMTLRIESSVRTVYLV